MSFYTSTDNFVIGGPKATLGSAVACGILLSVFEGIGVLLSRTMGEVNRPVAPPRTLLAFCLLSQIDTDPVPYSGTTRRTAVCHDCLIIVLSSLGRFVLVYTIIATLAYISFAIITVQE